MNTAYSPFSLHEYASGMLNEKVTVIEDERASTASVNLKTRGITIPAIDYSQPIDESYYRLVKGWIDHESAHILFTPNKYTDGLSCFPRHLRNLINLLEYIRIERLYAQQQFQHTMTSFHVF
mgnify:CR=1 FL=1